MAARYDFHHKSRADRPATVPLLLRSRPAKMIRRMLEQMRTAFYAVSSLRVLGLSRFAGLLLRPRVLLSGACLMFALTGTAVGADHVKSCEKCHSDPDFLVTNKKLYDYYKGWSTSIHKQEGVSCSDCHGGNPQASDKVEAHGKGVKPTDPASGVYYKNVPETCGSCHTEILEGFRESNHFKHVEKKDEEQGPTCVTCHGSVSTEILNVNNVSEACARCHNEESKNHPDNPEKARAILQRFLSIHRFYRYITMHAKPEEAKEFFGKIDPSMRRLVVTWHTFDLEKIDQGTELMLAALKAKRDEIRSRQAPRAE